MKQRPPRRKRLPPEVPVVSPDRVPAPQATVPPEPQGETDMTEDAIRKMLEAAYT
jgi:hypothetical protein